MNGVAGRRPVPYLPPGLCLWPQSGRGGTASSAASPGTAPAAPAGLIADLRRRTYAEGLPPSPSSSQSPARPGPRAALIRQAAALRGQAVPEASLLLWSVPAASLRIFYNALLCDIVQRFFSPRFFFSPDGFKVK